MSGAFNAGMVDRCTTCSLRTRALPVRLADPLSGLLVGRRAAAATPAAAARGSTKGEDKDSLTVGSPAAVRRLDCRGEDKDPPEFPIFPQSTTPPAAGRRLEARRHVVAGVAGIAVERLGRGAGATRRGRRVRGAAHGGLGRHPASAAHAAVLRSSVVRTSTTRARSTLCGPKVPGYGGIQRFKGGACVVVLRG